MKIKISRTGQTLADFTVLEPAVLEIDGQPYVPAPKPEPKRWEGEVHCYGFQDGDIMTSETKHTPETWKAAFKLAFDDTGRVWMADQRARDLAEFLRVLSRRPQTYSPTNEQREFLREAADRLCPEWEGR